MCARKVAVTGSTRVDANKICATQLVVQNINSRHSGSFPGSIRRGRCGCSLRQ
jgi:hypothetical protein